LPLPDLRVGLQNIPHLMWVVPGPWSVTPVDASRYNGHESDGPLNAAIVASDVFRIL
jgi:hypothetical protein